MEDDEMDAKQANTILAQRNVECALTSYACQAFCGSYEVCVVAFYLVCVFALFN